VTNPTPADLGRKPPPARPAVARCALPSARFARSGPVLASPGRGRGGRPLSAPPCCRFGRAFARGGSGGVLVSPHLPARAPACSGTLAQADVPARSLRSLRGLRLPRPSFASLTRTPLAASTAGAPARFLVSEPGGRATTPRPGARGAARTRKPARPGEGQGRRAVTRSTFLADSKGERAQRCPGDVSTAAERPQGAERGAQRAPAP
jgi:hypothetical protein